MENGGIPETVKENHILLIGEPGSPIAGQIITELTTQEERDNFGISGQYGILYKDNPWREGRLVIIASGSDENNTMRAAEEALANLMRCVDDLSRWYVSPYESVTRKDIG